MTNNEQDFRKFAEWVAEEVFNELWEVNYDAFAEIACRKLAKLGIVKATKTKWILEKSPEWHAVPSVSTEKTGHWKAGTFADYYTYICSECNQSLFTEYAFCPYCGARMEVEE